MTFSVKSALIVSVTALAFVACGKQTDLAQGQGSLPPEATGAAPSASLPDATTAQQTATHTIADVAASEGQFGTLLTAAKAAGLDAELNAPGPITVFAPTDAAFAALPPGKLDDLMKPENKDQLAALLKHHIVSGKVTSDDLVGKQSTLTMNGDVKVDAPSATQVKVADAQVIGPDIQTSNGVIHVVDKVLIPAT